MIRRFFLGVTFFVIAACSKQNPPRPAQNPPQPKPQNELRGPGDLSISTGDLWPRFRGESFDGVSKERGLITQLKTGNLKEVWSRSLTGGFSSVSVSRGRLLTMTKSGNDEIILCLDSRTGQLLWQVSYPANYEEYFGKGSGLMAMAPSGPRSTPTISNDRVFSLGTTGILHAVDLKSGKIFWKTTMSEIVGEKVTPVYGFTSSLLVVGDLVFVTTGGGTKGKALAALEVETGKVRWTKEDDTYSYSSPELIEIGGQKQVLFFTGRGAVAVLPKDGTVGWRHDFKSFEDQNTMMPILFGNKVFISSGYNEGRGVLLEVGKDKTKTLWTNRSLRLHFGTPILHDGVLYSVVEGGRLRANDFETGSHLWAEPGFGRGSVIFADEKLLVLSDTGELFMVEATRSDYKPIFRVQVLEGKSWTVPVLAGGILYVRDETTLKAFDLRGPGFKIH